MALLNLNDPTLFRQQAFIAGIWCDGQDSQRIDVDNPATGGHYWLCTRLHCTGYPKSSGSCTRSPVGLEA